MYSTLNVEKYFVPVVQYAGPLPPLLGVQISGQLPAEV